MREQPSESELQYLCFMPIHMKLVNRTFDSTDELEKEILRLIDEMFPDGRFREELFMAFMSYSICVTRGVLWRGPLLLPPDTSDFFDGTKHFLHLMEMIRGAHLPGAGN